MAEKNWKNPPQNRAEKPDNFLWPFLCRPTLITVQTVRNRTRVRTNDALVSCHVCTVRLPRFATSSLLWIRMCHATPRSVNLQLRRPARTINNPTPPHRQQHPTPPHRQQHLRSNTTGVPCHRKHRRPIYLSTHDGIVHRLQPSSPAQQHG